MKTTTYDDRRTDVAAWMIVLSLLFIGFFLLSSCSMFGSSNDAASTTLAASSAQKEKIFQDVINGFDKIIDASGVSAEVKRQYHEKVTELRASYAALQKSDLELLASLGTVDWKKAFDQLYAKIKDRQ